MTEPSIVQGRHLDAAQVEQIRQLLAGHSNWSRRRLSQELARLWVWRNPAGQLKDMAARTLLLKLERRGWIELPARRQIASNRMRDKRIPLKVALRAEDWDQRPSPFHWTNALVAGYGAQARLTVGSPDAHRIAHRSYLSRPPRRILAQPVVLHKRAQKRLPNGQSAHFSSS